MTHRYGHQPEIVAALERHRWQVEDALGRAGNISYHELVKLVDEDAFIGYANDGAVLICEPIKLTLGWMLCMFVGAGENDKVMELVDQAESDAKRAGASAITAIGRHGWIPQARKRGYRTETVILVKEF
jgi:hypothetical protein